MRHSCNTCRALLRRSLVAPLVVMFARKMSRLSHADLAALRIHQEWGKALGLTVAISAVPGLLLLAVPPLLTAITGIVFIPLLFIRMWRRLLEERAVLEATEQALHTRVEVDAAEAEAAYEEAVWAEAAERASAAQLAD